MGPNLRALPRRHGTADGRLSPTRACATLSVPGLGQVPAPTR